MAGCIFCAIAAGKLPASLIHEDERFLVFLDIYPMTPGHALVVLRRHAQRLAELDAAEAAGVFALAGRVGEALRRSGLPCDDVNVLLNDGRAANQSVPHLHVHVVPRRRGDIGRVMAKLVSRAAAPFLPAPTRAQLDNQASTIRAALATGEPARAS